MATLDEILGKIDEQSEAARAANLKRYEQAMAIYDEIISRYRPGGAFEAKTLGELEKRKTREVGAEKQELISSGLAGTTVMGGVGRRWEEEVGAPARLQLEDILMQRLSQAQLGKAEFMERREDVYPDYSLAAQLATQYGAAGGGGGGAGGMPAVSYGAVGGTSPAHTPFPFSQPDIPFGYKEPKGENVEPYGEQSAMGQWLTYSEAGGKPELLWEKEPGAYKKYSQSSQKEQDKKGMSSHAYYKKYGETKSGRGYVL